MVGDGLPVYGTRSSEVPLSGDAVVIRGESLPRLYVDAAKVAEVIGKRSDHPSLINSRLERLAELASGTV